MLTEAQWVAFWQSLARPDERDVALDQHHGVVWVAERVDLGHRRHHVGQRPVRSGRRLHGDGVTDPDGTGRHDFGVGAGGRVGRDAPHALGELQGHEAHCYRPSI